MHATQRKIFGLVVDIDGATYPIGDATERVIAQAALLRAGLVETPVYDVGYHSGTWTRTDAMFRLDPGIDIVGHTRSDDPRRYRLGSLGMPGFPSHRAVIEDFGAERIVGYVPVDAGPSTLGHLTADQVRELGRLRGADRREGWPELWRVAHSNDWESIHYGWTAVQVA